MSLNEDRLPRQFRGHFLESRISKVVATVKRYLEENKVAAGIETSPQTLSRDEVAELIQSALDRTETRALASTVMRQLSEMLPAPADVPDCPGSSGGYRLNESTQRAVRATLHSLLGLSQDAIAHAAPIEWPHQVAISTTTGLWSGSSRWEDWRSYNLFLRPCLLFRFDERKRVLAAAMLPQLVELDQGGTVISEPIALVGRGVIGELMD